MPRKKPFNLSPGNSKNDSNELMLRNGTTGRWIKRLDTEITVSAAHIPNTFIQVQNNNIYYTDIEELLKRISADREHSHLQELESLYAEILDSFDNFKSYSTGLNKVFDYCEKASIRFEAKAKFLTESLEPNNLTAENSKLIEGVVIASTRILLNYLYSAVVIHKEKVREETIIVRKIENLYEIVQKLLEKLLIPKTWDGKFLQLSESLYPAIIYKKEFDASLVDKFVQHDSRFQSATAVVQYVKDYLNDSNFETRGSFTIRGTFKDFYRGDMRIIFAKRLTELLDDIANLRNIRAEIGEISDITIIRQLESHTHKN